MAPTPAATTYSPTTEPTIRQVDAEELPAKESCANIRRNIEAARSAIVDQIGRKQPADDLEDARDAISRDIDQAPLDVGIELGEVYRLLSDAVSNVKSGVRLSGNTDEEDLDRSAAAALKVCDELAPVVTYTKTEQRFLKAYADAQYEDLKDVNAGKAVKYGRKACDHIGDRQRGYSRTKYLYERSSENLDSEEYFDVAVRYLCREYMPDLKRTKQVLDEGDHEVGEEARPGTYRTDRRIEDCYWERTTSGGRIIDNDFITFAAAGAAVTIRSSDGGFSTNGCGPWIPVR